jgi:VanZ family protein
MLLRTFRILRVFAWLGAAAIVVLTLLPGAVRPPWHPFEITQFEHALAYFVSGAVFALAYQEYRSSALIGIGLTVLAAVLELAQIEIPDRHPRLIDWAASAAGAWAGVGFALVLLWAQIRPRMQHGLLSRRPDRN